MNNRLGHSAGDKMLISIGKEICTQFRNDSNDAYRIGGDEFIIFAETYLNRSFKKNKQS